MNCLWNILLNTEALTVVKGEYKLMKQIELAIKENKLCWKYSDELEKYYKPLLDLSELKGQDGEDGRPGYIFSPIVTKKDNGSVILSWETDAPEEDHINDFLPEAIDIRGEKGDCFYKNLAASIMVPEYDIAASSYSAFDNEPTVDIKVDDDNKTIQFIFGIPRVIPSYGHIDDRPKESETCHIPIGFCYFATNLQKPLWWNGTSWVDAMGTVVAMA